jgi:N-methylhydantoinase A/oxoprolinase/acetone carboxylase beta subunit
LSTLLGIDTGGTYTDAVLYDQKKGVLASAKALTTKHDLAIGISNALEAVLKPDVAEIGLVSLSTTLATNAIVEGQGSPICLLLLGYPSDALELAGLGKALGSDPVVFIEGGHTLNGDEQAPLDLEAARRAVQAYASHVEAFAVSGYFGVHNPAHELAVRDLVRQLTDLPVTCGHELSSNLHAPRRALTAALNARLIPFLQQLILSVKATLEQKGIRAPLMVVKGDGSLVEDQVALERPVETILSGPAASVVGACHLSCGNPRSEALLTSLSGEGDVIVVDMGGTTTDIALLQNGQPELSRDGALVGGWHTMVEAIAVHTYGLGGDSEVTLDDKEGLVIGPQRVVPLSLLGSQHPMVLDELRRQTSMMARERKPFSYDGRFAQRLRPVAMKEDRLDDDEKMLWERLAGDGPLPLELLFANRSQGLSHGNTYLFQARALGRLVGRGLVALSAFTPTDAAHVLGHQTNWSVEAAQLGAALWVQRLDRHSVGDESAVIEFCQRVLRRVTVQLGRATLATAVTPHSRGDTFLYDLDLNLSSPARRFFIDRALNAVGDTQSLLQVDLTLRLPLVAVGAPVATYFPPLVERLHTRLVIPPHAEVANAVGAVVGSVVQVVRATIRKLAEDGGYRVHLSEGVQDFERLEEAAEFAMQATSRLAQTQARRAGAYNPKVELQRHDHVYHPESGAWEDVYLGTDIVATAAGRPRLGV